MITPVIKLRRGRRMGGLVSSIEWDEFPLFGDPSRTLRLKWLTTATHGRGRR